jgi:endonuclease YncB( thermonuclease family)
MKISKHEHRIYEPRAIDGDTIEAWVDIGHRCRIQWKIRLRGIEGGEMDTAEGQVVFAHMVALIQAEELKGGYFFGNVNELDKYGRHVGDIMLPDKSLLTQRLFSSGLFWRRARNGHEDKQRRN